MRELLFLILLSFIALPFTADSFKTSAFAAQDQSQESPRVLPSPNGRRRRRARAVTDPPDDTASANHSNARVNQPGAEALASARTWYGVAPFAPEKSSAKVWAALANTPDAARDARCAVSSNREKQGDEKQG